MNNNQQRRGGLLGSLVLGMALIVTWSQALASHEIPGITQHDVGGTSKFELYAFPFNMNLPDGSSLHMWGFGDKDGTYNLPQYPAPTLIVNQDDVVTINLENSGVPNPVSIVVAGHQVTASSVSGATQPGLVTAAAANVGGIVEYTFTASEPGTYIYHSLDGSNPGLHTEMGLIGVLIVRPTGYDAASNQVAYEETGTDYDHEYLYFLTESDPEVHFQAERGHFNHFTNSDRAAKIWYVNGRVFPDLFQGDFNSLYPHQPYQALAMTEPGQRVLVREVNGGHDSHPFHHHGENLRFIARDGRVMSSDGLTADLGRSDNTLNSAPKQAVDMIWTWTGEALNWDIYGTPAGGVVADHSCNSISVVACTADGDPSDCGSLGFDGTTHEYCLDHGKEIPVTLPGVQDMTLGGWWSGSPFLGDVGDLPPGEGGLNPFGGYFLVWHSHAEKELTTFDIFPGGSLSTVVVVPPGTLD